ncbi:MAG: caspase family protein [Treponema sp.]|nr:caspase family protein [Treponema sp.]
MNRKYFIFIIIFVVLQAGIHAQQDSAVPGKFALIIGNGAYTGGLNVLANPVNDANDMAESLASLGFIVDKVLDGDLEGMEDAIQRFARNLYREKNTYGFFFYAGHGVQAGGDNYLIPVNANIPSESSLRTRAVSVQNTLDDLNKAGNNLNIMVLDACRDNPFSWGRSRTGAGSRGLAVINAPVGSIVVYATSANSTADDGTGRNGLFTSQLLNNIKTPGISVQEMFNRTGADVLTASEGRQHPEISLRYFGTAYLGNSPAAAAVTPPVTQSALPSTSAPLPVSPSVNDPQPSLPVRVPRPVREYDRAENFWSLGASLGTSFAAPVLVANLSGTLSPFRNSFFEIGVDFGFLSGLEDVGYYSISPFVHYAFSLPLANLGRWYIGAGGSYYYAEYDFPQGIMPVNIFALDITAGLYFNFGMIISYTIRTDFSTAGNTLTVGYRYRFNRD